MNQIVLFSLFSFHRFSEVILSTGEAIDEQLSWKIQDVPPGDYMVTGETAEFFIDGQTQKLASSPESWR